MNILKTLVKLNNKLEATWSKVDFLKIPVEIRTGWYVCEFTVPGTLDHLPRLVVTNDEGKEVSRHLVGVHAGRNRMMFYLPEGNLTAHSRSINFERLARVSNIEARCRTWLICARYLRDFFSIRSALKMIALQFQAPFERSNSLLRFYAPDAGTQHYLENVSSWNRFKGFSPRLLAPFVGSAKIAVLIEDQCQRESLDLQIISPDWILCLNEDNVIPQNADYILPLRKSEILQPAAILMLKRAIKKAPESPDLIYTDHDYAPRDIANEIEGQTQISAPLPPVFKPQPSRVYLACFNYLGASTLYSIDAVSGRLLSELLNDEHRYFLALELFKDRSKVMHIPEALFRSDRVTEELTPEPRSSESAWPGMQWLRRHNYNVLVAAPDANEGPSVDLVIPTRDGLSVLKPCIDGILEKTEYRNFKVIVVDNGSEKSETFDYFKLIEKDPRVTVVTYPGEFNYSAINNFAVEHGDSKYVGLINNDIEVINGDWLTQMMGWAQQPEVGIVGAKLLFSDGRVQHAGVTIGMGNAAGHIHRLEDGQSPGYQMRCLATQNMMAVTAACLITPRDLFEKIGGLDAQAFKVAYNDIDYCLKVEASGKDVIWTPEAILYHHESVSRGDDMSAPHVERYFRELGTLQSRWKTKGFVDKYYSKHLRVGDEGVYPKVEAEQSDQLIYLSEQ